MIFPFGDNVPSRRLPVVTTGIVCLNILGLVWLKLLPDDRQQMVAITHGFVPARISQLIQPRPLLIPVERLVQFPHIPGHVFKERRNLQLPADRSEIVASLFTAMFLHGGWLHMLGNMWFLWIFGDNVEDRLGHLGYLLFYLGGGLIASLCHWAIDSQSTVPVIGASGAVSAILGAYAITWPWARIRCIVLLIIFITVFELPALFVLGFWFLTQLLEANHALKLGMDGGVAWWAHIGGFVAGMVLMPLISQEPARSEEPDRADNSGLPWA